MTPEHILTSPSASHCVVVGGGTMGADVAFLLFRAGARVTVIETRDASHAALRERLSAQSLSDHPVRLQPAQVVATLDEVDWASVSLVIECIPEILAAKQALFKDLEARAPASAILASNSSSFPIGDIAQGLASAERMLGLHFFMPAHVVPLVEVVLGDASSPTLGDALAAFMRRCDSVPILVRRDIPGFVANRLQHALGREAYSLIQAGIATPEDIDAAVRFGFGFRYLAAGPVLQKEIAGLDVHASAAATIYPTLSNISAPPAVLADKLKEGKFGMKTGEGFRRWTEDDAQREKARYQRVLQAALAAIADELPDIEP